MKIGKLNALLISAAILGSFSFVTKAQTRAILDKEADNVEISELDVRFAVAKLAQIYNVPIGLETSIAPDDHRQVLSSKNMTLKAALDQLIEDNPDYKWTFEGGVVNIFPARNRDPSLNSLLGLKVDHFSAPQLLSTLDLRVLLGDLPEVKTELCKNGLKLVALAFFSSEIYKRDLQKPLSFDNRTLREILNELVKRDEINFWSIARFGKNREFVTIGL